MKATYGKSENSQACSTQLRWISGDEVWENRYSIILFSKNTKYQYQENNEGPIHNIGQHTKGRR